MNRKTYFQLAAAFLGTLLLYQANWGLNAFLFALLVLCLLVSTKRLPLLPALLFGVAGLLVAASASILSVVLYLLLLFVLLSQVHSSTSWPTATLDGIGRIFSGGWQVVVQQKQTPIPGFSLGKGLLLTLPSIGITIIFYSLYANASPAFADKVSLAQLQLPHPYWFVLFFGLYYASYSLTHTLPSMRLQQWDKLQPNILERRRTKSFLNPFWLKYEYKTALMVLVLLNSLLLLFHGVDVATLLEGKPAEGITYAQWVHQGVGTLIISILIAVALLLYVFRGNLNFFRQNQSLKTFAMAWIIQNALLALTTVLKNSCYIEAYGLTYKRIGLWVYLLLVLVGLITTWHKITQRQTLWWMIKRNYKAAILLLLLTAAFPWARIISWYNLEQAQVRDNAYLLQLPLYNTDQLLKHLHTLPLEQERQVLLRKESLLETTSIENWKSWTILNHYAAQNLETTK